MKPAIDDIKSLNDYYYVMLIGNTKAKKADYSLRGLPTAIYLYSQKSGGKRLVVKSEPKVFNHGVAISKDNKALAYIRSPYNSLETKLKDYVDSSIEVVSISGDKIASYAFGYSCYINNIRYGKYIAVSVIDIMNRESDKRRKLYFVNPDMSEPVLVSDLLVKNLAFDWHPDSEQLLYAIKEDNIPKIVSHNVSTEEPKVLWEGSEGFTVLEIKVLDDAMIFVIANDTEGDEQMSLLNMNPVTNEIRYTREIATPFASPAIQYDGTFTYYHDMRLKWRVLFDEYKTERSQKMSQE